MTKANHSQATYPQLPNLGEKPLGSKQVYEVQDLEPLVCPIHPPFELKFQAQLFGVSAKSRSSLAPYVSVRQL